MIWMSREPVPRLHSESALTTRLTKTQDGCWRLLGTATYIAQAAIVHTCKALEAEDGNAGLLS